MDEIPPRAPRLTAKGSQTRLRIVASAAELIHHQGVAGTTLDEVKATAGVSSSQLYHYFADKHALVRAVIAHQTDAMVGIQQHVDFRTARGRRAWRNTLVNYVQERQCRGGCPLGSLGDEISKSDDAARQEVAASFARWQAMLETDLRAMQGAGKLSAGVDPVDLAVTVLAAVQGGLLLSQVQRSIGALETALDSLLRYIDLLADPTK
jgi:TetR/AcrR family transcriptional regulator, transcriptional repressor for nem operon